MRKTILLLMAVSLSFFVLTSCSKDEEDDEPKKNVNNSLLLKCPDDHHPHAIDLGLPSGTKWCCCNVGAKTPEDYGGYYAWGETSEKSIYNWDTYAYCYKGRTCLDIGYDIAGTKYDVAHVLMGGSWRMPSIEQIRELMHNCTRTWTTLNGVGGTLITGKNGGQIFLPPAGFIWDDVLDLEGTGGFFWSSTFDFDQYALNFSCSSGYWEPVYWETVDYYRGGGESVRAVCP